MSSTPMTEIGGVRGYGEHEADPRRHEPHGHDILSYGEPVAPDPATRRLAAEANARAAEARAASAAADAKAAIELAARAAAAADAAARAAAEAGAAARAAVQADAGPGVGAGGGAHSAPPWTAGPRHGAAPLGGAPFADTAPDTAPDTDVLHHVVPAPRPEPARHAAPVESGYLDRGHLDQDHVDRDHVDRDHAGSDYFDRDYADRDYADQDYADEARGLAGGRAERRRAAAETTVFAEPLVVDEPPTDLVDTSAAAQGPADDRPGDEPGRPADDRPSEDQVTALVDTGRRRRGRAGTAPDVADDRYETDDAPATGGAAAGGRRAARRARTGLFRRRGRKLAAGAVVGALALSGLVWLNSGADTMEPASMVEATPAVPQLPTDAEPDTATPGQGDPLSERGTEFLAALRQAGVPTSQGGAAETEAAELVCAELADGVDEARIARALPASLPTVTRAQAADLVDVAQETYCTS